MNECEPLNTLTNNELQNVVLFTNILTKVNSRVSSAKLTSTVQINTLGKGLLDKLEIYLPHPKSVDEIAHNCSVLGLKTDYKYLTDKRYYFVIHISSQIIYCQLGVQGNEQFNKVIINPSKSETYSHAEKCLRDIFGLIILDAKIYRIDFTVDIFEPYEQIIRGLNIKYKSARVEYIQRTARTGIKIGSKNDKIIIYNKALKEKGNKPRTRIERQMSGSKVPIKKLFQLKDSLQQVVSLNLLDVVTLNNLELVEPSSAIQEQKEKFYRLKTLIEYEGYYLSRKKLNKNNNFERDYGKFYTLTPYKEQPSDIFNSDMIDFLGDTK